MQFTTTSPIGLFVFVAIVFLGPMRGVFLLLLTLPLGAASAVNLQGLGTILLSDAAIFALWVSLIIHRVGSQSLLGSLRPLEPGFALIWLLVVASIGAMFLPRIFAGATDVVAIVRTVDGPRIDHVPLQFTSGNISQVFRLLLPASAFLILASVYRSAGDGALIVRAMITVTLLHAFLSLADLISGLTGVSLVNFLRTANVNVLDNQVLFGLRRMVGAFPEPSSYAFYTIGLFGFWLQYWFRTSRSFVPGILLIITMLLLLRSTSSAGWVAMTIYLGLFLLWQVRRVARNRRAALLYIGLTFLIPALVAGAVLLYVMVPIVSAALDQLIFDKLSTSSGEERMSWNRQAIQNFLDTSGFGAGMGSLRGSGWFFVCLGSLGALGTALYLWFVFAVLFKRAPRVFADTQTAITAAALQSACAAILLQACLTKPYPNLEASFFAMAGLAVGLLRQLSLRQYQVERSQKIERAARMKQAYEPAST